MTTYSVAEAALRLGVTDNAVLQAIYRESLPAEMHAGRYRITEADLERYRTTRNRTQPRRRKVLSDEEVRTVRAYLDAGVSQPQLAADFGVSQGTISNVKRGIGPYGKVPR